MLEIWLLMLLCKSCKNNALERGRRPGGFIALAISLWIVFEIIGFIIGYSLELGYATFFVAYGLVGASVAISYNVAKHCKQGDYITPTEQTIRQFTEYYEPLPVESNIMITREKAFSGSAARYDMVLNGRSLGLISNGDTLHGRTDQRQNVLVARAGSGNDVPPFVFQVADGCDVDIHFAAGRFIPERSTGIVAYGKAVTLNPALAVPRYVPVMNTQQVAPVYAPVQQPSPYAPPVQAQQVPVQAPQAQGAHFCDSCGKPVNPGAKFCGNCGTPIG